MKIPRRSAYAAAWVSLSLAVVGGCQGKASGGADLSPPVSVDLGVDLHVPAAPDMTCLPAPPKDGGAALPCIDEGFKWLTPNSVQAGVARILSFGPNDAWATGWGSVLRWDGKAWKRMATPRPVRGRHLWGSTPDDVWIEADSARTASLLHWSGGQFDIVPLPFSGDNVVVEALSGSGGNVWVAGYVDAKQAERRLFLLWRDCNVWREVPLLRDAGPSIQDLLVLGENDVWMIDYRRLRHWDGKSWAEVAVEGFTRTAHGPDVFLERLWGTRSDDLWALGSDAEGSPSKSRSGVYRGGLGGLKPFYEAGVTGIGGAANDLRVVGPQGVIVQWNGSRWMREASGTTERLSEVDQYFAATSEGRLLQRVGGAWRTAPGWPEEPVQEWVAGWAGSPTEAWVVGQGAAHWDGKSWRSVPALAGQELKAVWGRGPQDVWFAGARVFRWDGKQVREVVDRELVPRVGEFIGIWGPRQGPELWLIELKRVVRWTGVVAVDETLPGAHMYGPSLRRIGGTGVEDVWLTGGGGLGVGETIWRRRQGAWSVVYQNKEDMNFLGFAVVGGDDVWAGYKDLLHWDGKGWMRFASADLAPEVAFAANDVWAIGPRQGSLFGVSYGPPWRWNGKEWRCIRGVPLAATIFGSGPNDVWLAGWGGALLHKGP